MIGHTRGVPRSRASLVLVTALACGPPRARLPPAGSPQDDGDGWLARLSVRLLTAEPTATPIAGDTGGDTYGGATYAGYVVPPWSYPAVDRTPGYVVEAGLTGAIEGTITWRGALPVVASACGPIVPLDIAPGTHRVAGVLVYIETLRVGRIPPHRLGDQRPATVGGVVAKRGCALVPTVQLVNPLPALLAIHGDATAAHLRIAPAVGPARVAELQPGGRIELEAPPGVTQIDSEDGTLGAAWVLGLATPAFALTDDTGTFRLDELAPGTYDLTIWQPPIPVARAGALVYGPPVIAHRSVTVTSRGPARLDVVLGR